MTTSLSRRSLVLGGAGLAGTLALTPSALAAPNSTLSVGSHSGDVKNLQNRLNSLGYWCGSADGVFGGQTEQAVLALQKVAGLSRDGVVGAKTRAALSKGARPASRRGGNRIEVDKGRQILMVVRGGKVSKIFNTSTGSGAVFYYEGARMRATTPAGEFHTFRRVANGWDYGALGGLYRPFYFNGGIAIHGAASVPAYPASHGCCRLSIAAQDYLISSGMLTLKEAVSVY